MNEWVLPITLIPGAGLLIMSTTQIANALSAELNQLIFQRQRIFIPTIRMKLFQLRLLSIALFGLYISCSCFAIAAFLAGLEVSGWFMLEKLGFVLICLGIMAIVIALTLLILYAYRAVRIKQMQFEDQLQSLNQEDH